MQTKVLLNYQEINNPLNIEELEIELNFDKGNPQAQISLNSFDFGVGDKNDVKDGSRIINQYIQDGIDAGGLGIYQALPLQIIISDGGVSYTLLDGGLDVSTGLIDCNIVTANSIDNGGVDWLNDVADGFSLRDLEDGLTNGAGKITANDITLIPYVINSIPNYREAFLVFISVYVFVQEIKSNIQILLEHSVGGANPFQAVDLVKAALRIAYIIITLIAMVKLVIQLFNLLIQPIKYHAGMNVLLQCQRGAEYLGMTFESSILQGIYKDLLILPEKNTLTINEDKDGIFGFLSASDKTPHKGSANMTYGNLLRALISQFKGKILIDNGVIRLEREDFNNSTELYQLPDVRETPHTYNSDELKSNYNISFQTDVNDKNTIQEYEGVSIGIRTVPKFVGPKGLVLNKGFENVSIPFALGKVKTELSIPEKIFDVFFEAMDVVLGQLVKIVNLAIEILNKITKQLNKILKSLKAIGIKVNINLQPIEPVTPPSFGNLIDDRLGMLVMENDDITIPKMLIVKSNNNARNNKPLATNSTLLTAEYLWNKYHYISSFDPIKYDKHNQYTNRDAENVPFCFTDYTLVKNSNKILTASGQNALAKSIKWNPAKLIATFEYRINEVHSSNFKTFITIPDGK